MHSKRRQQQQQSSASAVAAPTSVPPHHHHHHQHHLQPVQDEDLRRLNLPPSIPVSRDGEEGAVAYNLRLQQSNADAKPDCYQAPPNRTVIPIADPLVVAPGGPTSLLSHHSTSTPSLKTLAGATSPTQLFLDASKFRSTKHHHLETRMLPQPTRLAEPHRHPVGIGDYYVSGSLLTTWRTTSPDRWELSAKKSIIPFGGAVGGLPSPPYLGHPGGSTPGEEDLAEKRPGTKQRSSSADSVRRLVAKCSLLRFARKQTTKAPKASTSGVSLPVDPTQKHFDEQLDEGQTPGVSKDQKAPPWELPPNYVDMIFTKDPPATIDASKKDNVIKQQQQQQQHQEKQQRQQQHCCFNS